MKSAESRCYYTHMQPFTAVVRTKNAVKVVSTKAFDEQSARRRILRTVVCEIDFIQVGIEERHTETIREQFIESRAVLAKSIIRATEARKAARKSKSKPKAEKPVYVLPACLRPSAEGVDRSADLGRGVRALLAEVRA